MSDTSTEAVERFRPYATNDENGLNMRMEPHQLRGYWVRYYDYTTLLAERDALQAKLDLAVDALKECQQELDQYSKNEYPSDHPYHVRKRERDYDANPARIVLAQLTKEGQQS